MSDVTKIHRGAIGKYLVSPAQSYRYERSACFIPSRRPKTNEPTTLHESVSTRIATSRIPSKSKDKLFCCYFFFRRRGVPQISFYKRRCSEIGNSFAAHCPRMVYPKSTFYESIKYVENFMGFCFVAFFSVGRYLLHSENNYSVS